MRVHFFLTILLLLGFCFPAIVFAQEEDDQDTVSNGILMNKELKGSIMLHTLGYGVGFRKGINKDFFERRMIEFDLLEMKAPNQEKTYNNNFMNPKYYYFGKLNNLYILRAGLGKTKLLNRKPYWGGVEVRFNYSGGLSLGLAKPVYLYMSYYHSDMVIYATKSEKFDPSLTYPVTTPTYSYDIYGRAPVFTGFKEIKPYPGIYAKAGFNFDFGVLNERVKELETGLVLDVYPKGVPIMAYHSPYQLFLTAYFSFSFGKRYN